MPRAQIKDEKTYQELRKRGETKEKSARIANASASSSRQKVAAKGGRSGSYPDWPKADLVMRAVFALLIGGQARGLVIARRCRGEGPGGPRKRSAGSAQARVPAMFR